jgi:hypothetical protein
VGQGVDEEGGVMGHHHAQHPGQQHHAEQIPVQRPSSSGMPMLVTRARAR